mmetsp:Transcript_15630/g.17655  ORF Transcript_15630/g.17655 Transcript_15630/m.17655 type:complete len:507 (+) Transcript_15630:71-1591(+)
MWFSKPISKFGPRKPCRFSRNAVYQQCRFFSLTKSKVDPPVLARRGDPDKLKKLFRSSFCGSQVSEVPAVLEAHGKDESLHTPVPPDLVFFPKSTEEVVEAMKLAKEADSCVIPFGVGTSLEGHIAALQGGVCIDMSAHMNKVLEINDADMDCRIQAGIVRSTLNYELRHSGLFFPIDPGADCTIGGMVGTRASGTNAVRYGTMKQSVLGLECVLADGSVLRTGSRAKKSSAGYDLTSLFVGSEGTLGVVTEVQLKLFGQPEAIRSAVCNFDSLNGAVDTVVTALQYGIPLARAELLDSTTMRAVSDYSKIPLEQKPTLFLEFHGTEQFVNEQVQMVHEISLLNGGGDFKFAESEEERNRLWNARHTAYYAVMALRKGCKGWPTDVCVPLSSMAQCIEETVQDVTSTGIHGPLFGHVGDGNFHVILLYNPETDTEEYLSKLIDFNSRLVQRSISLGGTCTGEHGVGYGKAPWLLQEHGEVAVNTMKAIKSAIDPDNRMNPGKLLPQ